MKVCHSCFAHHVLVNSYSRCFFEEYDGLYILTIQWGVNGICVFTEFRSTRSLVLYVQKLVDGRARRAFLRCLESRGLIHVS